MAYSREVHERMWNLANAWIKSRYQDPRVLALGGVEDAISEASDITAYLTETFDANEGDVDAYFFRHFPLKLGQRLASSARESRVEVEETAELPNEEIYTDTISAFYSGLTPNQRSIAGQLMVGETEESIASSSDRARESVKDTRESLKTKLSRFLLAQETTLPRGYRELVANAAKPPRERLRRRLAKDPAAEASARPELLAV